ncbi:MAG TPA: phytochelatin synthase family protein [Gammaproteobacteria bacterium]|nr:phytochelatin synthase family protein [Gammaproteobacteria bacterium]
MRPLPATLPAFDSAGGRRLFGEALLEGGMASYFRLAQQFHTHGRRPARAGRRLRCNRRRARAARRRR